MKNFVIVLLHLLTAIEARAQLADLRINQIQVIGSHNSYKQAIYPRLFKLLSKDNAESMAQLDYDHITLTEQLNLGLLNLEIDVYGDTAGGKYAHPKGLDWEPNQPAFDTGGVMKTPGFKVFHVPEIDFRSNCATFKICLQELKKWSAAHPDHAPVFITMNAKDEPVDKPGFTIPEQFTPALYDALDKEIIDYLGKENCLTPDEVRGNYATLEAAVLAGNWPTVQQAAGKFIFILDETGEKIDRYVKGHPSLKGRMLFANALPGSAEAAILIRNHPKADTIKQLVQKGYIVRTRADADTKAARENDRSYFAAACESGAQIITTDYYRKSTHFVSDYVISFAGKTYIRKNVLMASVVKAKGVTGK
jgi:hypothetical protein